MSSGGGAGGGMMNPGGATGGPPYATDTEDDNYLPDLTEQAGSYSNAQYADASSSNQNSASYGYQGYEEMDYLADFKMGGGADNMSTWGNLGQGGNMPNLHPQWMGGDGGQTNSAQQMKMEYSVCCSIYY